MIFRVFLVCGTAALGVTSAAHAQSTSIQTGPDGSLSGQVSAGNAPALSVQTGDGQARTRPSSTGGRLMTIRSPDGSSSTSVWSSGSGETVMAGSGSPGSTIHTDSGERSEPRTTSTRRGPYHVRHGRTHHRGHSR